MVQKSFNIHFRMKGNPIKFIMFDVVHCVMTDGPELVRSNQ